MFIYFNVVDYLYATLSDTGEMPDNYFLIVENNCGIAYQKNNTLIQTSLVSSHIATQESNKLAEEMGKRKLAYEIRKFSEGFYIVIKFEAKPELISELERNYRIDDGVLKFITVRNED